MKLSYMIISALWGVVATKNVVNIYPLDDSILKAVDLEFKLGKREAKNVFNLLETREAKNIVNIASIEDNAFDFRKRDSKNIVDLKLELTDANLFKRDGKNVINLNLDNVFIEKRDAKNLINLNLFINDDSDLVKRDGCHMNVKLNNMQLSDDQIEHMDGLNILIDGESYEISNKETSNDNDLFLALKPWNNDKVATYIWDLSPLTSLMESLQLKAQTYLASNSLSGHTELFEPLKGDLASALTINDNFRLFSSYLRQLIDIYTRCESNDHEYKIQEDQKELLIFAPTDQAMIALSEKPWEFPQSLDDVVDEVEKDSVILSNIRHFVESHIVESNNIDLDNSKENMVELRTINNEIIFLKNDGSKGFWIHSGDDHDDWILVESIQIVENGALLSIPQTLSHS